MEGWGDLGQILLYTFLGVGGCGGSGGGGGGLLCSAPLNFLYMCMCVCVCGGGVSF